MPFAFPMPPPGGPEESSVGENLGSERRDGVVWLTIQRPDQMNAISTGVVRELLEEVEAARSNPEDRVIVLTGAGRAFCAGADLREAAELTRSPAEFRGWLLEWKRAFTALEQCPKPVIGAINGLCLAGGLELALACDVLVASDAAQIGDVHARYGLVPGGGGSRRLTNAVGVRRARWLMYTGRTLSAHEAEQWGIVQHVVAADRFADEVREIATEMARRSQPSLAFMKRLSQVRDDEGLDLELEAAAHLVAGPDAQEGLAAFLAKREPEFTATITS